MKKIMLIVGMILCVAVIGSVFAVAVMNAQSAATFSADGYIYLGFDGTSSNGIVLSSGVVTPFTVVLTVDSNVANTGTLTITFADGADKNLDDVSFGVYSDSNCMTALTTNVTTEDKVITITGISGESTTIYVGVMLKANADADEINDCGGTMTLHFAPAI